MPVQSCHPRLLVILLIAVIALTACGDTDAEPSIPLGTPISLSTQTPESTVIEDTSGASSGTDPAGNFLTQSTSSAGRIAPEFAGISSWINSEPLTMASLRGRVVLVDFWTYTCINCIRTFEYLKDWYGKYADLGLTIVGVHSPEFDFEKLRKNVLQSSAINGLEYPIAQDNEFVMWRAYSNQAWPAKYLIDAQGIIRHTHVGEGGYIETEREIRQLLSEAGSDVTRVSVGNDSGPSFDPKSRNLDQELRLTEELYTGFERNLYSGPYVDQPGFFLGGDETRTYEDPGEHYNNFIYLQGDWFNGKQYLVHARETERYEDYIALKASATTVNVVIGPQVEGAFDVQVTIDGRPLTRNEVGADVVIQSGKSYVNVTEARMYQILNLPSYGTHELRLSSNSKGFAVFAFTFGGYVKES